MLGVLAEAGLVEGKDLNEVAKDIMCNELLVPESHALCSAQDKLDAFKSMLERWEGLEGNERDTITIYVGDSTTDLGCLCHASVGIFMGDCSSKDNGMIEILNRLHVNTFDIDKLPTSEESEKVQAIKTNSKNDGWLPHVVCGVQSFKQIDDWLARLDNEGYSET